MAVIDPHLTLAEIVTRHPDAAPELERRKLDYCCGGAQSLAEACEAVGLDAGAVATELSALSTAPPQEWSTLGAADLVDHLESTHHAYLHIELPRLSSLAEKVASVHGANHGELDDVRDTFEALRADLEPHLAKEEQVLFPMIRKLAAATEPPSFHCGSLQNPISVTLAEHDRAGELLAQLRELTGDFTMPADGCASYEALYRSLRAIETDTHQHVHKENNRLFPLVVELEGHLDASKAPA